MMNGNEPAFPIDTTTILGGESVQYISNGLTKREWLAADKAQKGGA